ncbi:DNA polymerase [Pantoea phage Phynn]|nr:DNA polymerase [Pantoea phage Phynn]
MFFGGCIVQLSYGIDRNDINHKVKKMKTCRPELSLEENTPLNNFINSVLKTRFHDKIKDSRNYDIADQFAGAFGYNTRYRDDLSRPDTDPRWTDITWSAGSCGFSGRVKNVRVAYLPHCYAQALEDLTKDSDIRFPNGELVYDVVCSLRRIRKINKDYAKVCRTTMTIRDKLSGEYLRCLDIISLTKYLLNSLIYIIANYGRPTGIGVHHLRESVRNRTADLIRKINNTDATVIHASYDHVVYVGPQVEYPNVHHESFKNAILIGENGIVYGDTMESFRVPFFCINDDSWVRPVHDIESRTKTFQKNMEKRKSMCKASVAQYLNLTKEDIERKNDIDYESTLL